MLNHPNIHNPLVMTYSGHIPALKNDKTLVTNSSGKARIIKNTSVTDFMNKTRLPLVQQVEDAGFDMIEMPHQVGAIVVIRFFSKNPPAVSDGDNAYTTLQETWQSERRSDDGKITRQGLVGVIEDDRQVSFGSFIVKYVPLREAEGAEVYLWRRYEDSGYEEFEEAQIAYNWGRKKLKDRFEVRDISGI